MLNNGGNKFIVFFNHVRASAHAMADDDSTRGLVDVIIDNVWRGELWRASDVKRWWFMQDGMSLVKIVEMADLFLATKD